jgi:dTMP kinase
MVQAERKDSGLFITFEGPEGAGKTTQITLLEQRLATQGRTITRTREPGGDSVGERVRELLLNGSPGVEAELLLFAAARAQNVQTVVRPALEAGHVVLCDRFIDSTVAYQGFARGLNRDFINRINVFATGGLMPDRTYLLDLPVADGLLRRHQDTEQNRLDRESLSFHEKVRDGFLSLVQDNTQRIILIDASRSVDAVSRDLWESIQQLL